MNDQSKFFLNLDQFDKVNLKSWQLTAMLLMMTGTGLKTFTEMSYVMQEAYISTMQSLATDAHEILSIAATDEPVLDKSLR